MRSRFILRKWVNNKTSIPYLRVGCHACYLLVTQEQFDELLHKFSLLEQLMQQDKSKISDLESSVTQYQQDRQQLRRSFVEIDTEVQCYQSIGNYANTNDKFNHGYSVETGFF